MVYFDRKERVMYNNIDRSWARMQTKMLGRLKDKRFEFLLSPGEYDGTNKNLHDLLMDWIDPEHAVTVLDLGGVPGERAYL